MQQQVYNPAYGGYIPPMQPPMQQHQPSFQQPSQQPLQQFGVPGRVVGNVSEIKVDDVPTNGSIGWFPMSDGSAVVAKRWTADGNIVTMTYALQQQEAQPDPAEIMIGKLDQILDAVTAKPARHATKVAENA